MAHASLPSLGRLQGEPLHLTDLPNEILHQVIRELLPARFRDSKYLASLCLVCKRFRDIVEPHLYHTLTLEVDIANQRVIQTTSAGEGVFSPVIGYSELLRTLTERPSLSNLVRVLSLGTNEHEFYGPHFVEHHLPILTLFNMLKDLHLGFPPMYSKFPSMPTLKHLHLDFTPGQYYPPEDTSLFDKEKIKMKTLFRGLQIPSLQKVITQEQLYDTQDLYDTPELMPLSFKHHHQRPSLVSEVHLFQCRYASTDLLGDIILSIKCLKSFVIDHQSWSGYDDREHLSGIDQALSKHQGSLEELMIAASGGITLNTTTPFESLLSFTALKRLAVPEYFLIPSNGRRNSLHEILPPSLCELQLQHYMEDVQVDHDLPRRVELYTSLCENKYTSLPALKRLICWYQQPPDKLRYPDAILAPEIAEDLVSQFKKVSVHFQWGKTSVFLATPFGTELDVSFSDRMVEKHGWNKNQYLEDVEEFPWD